MNFIVFFIVLLAFQPIFHDALERDSHRKFLKLNFILTTAFVFGLTYMGTVAIDQQNQTQQESTAKERQDLFLD